MDFSTQETKVMVTALTDYKKKLDKLMSQCIKQEQSSAAEKVLANIKLVDKIIDTIKEEK